MGRFWHPFADMATVSTAGELVLESGEGVRVKDVAGREYLDATAGLWYTNVGYGRAEIADAMAAQARKIHAYSNFGDMATTSTLELVDRLGEIVPVPDSAVFLTSGGSDSVDTAVKLARAYWQELGQPGKTVFIARDHAYHGMHVAGTSLGGIPANRSGYGALLDGVYTVAWDDPDALAAKIDELGAENVAAFFCEPVIGAGGVYPPPDGYLKAAREVCRERDVLFVADEVITGFGRTGAWFASGRFDLEPDLVTCAKGITSGYAPLGAVFAVPRVADPFWSEPGKVVWRHGYTYSGHATACAAALANLAIVADEKLPQRVDESQHTLADLLAPLASHPLVGEVRSGVGLLAAVVLDADAQASDPSLGARVVAAMRESGVLTRLIAGGGLQFSPPLIADDAELAAMADATKSALDAVAAAA
ncbi:MAG TPA: aminotransferase class III-fold pyridoxal phosphate-dependent enzyme [Streptosporangiales bacterium]